MGSVNDTVKKASLHPLKPWLVVFTGALFFFYDFIQLNMFNALNLPLIREFHVSALQLGQLSAYYFYAVVPLLFPAGIILDRVSTRKIILLSMALLTFGTFLFAIAHQFWITEVCRFITGVGGTFCLLSAIKLASRWFPPTKMALVVGLIVTLAMFGGVVAQTPLIWLTDTLGWRQTLLIDGLLGLFFLIIMFIVLEDYPPGYAVEHQKQQGFLSELGFWASLRLTAANLQNWLGGIYTSLLNLPIFLLGGIWGTMYLAQAQQLTRMQASLGTTMLFIGTIIGCPVIGWFSDRIGLRKLPMIGGSIIALVIILFIMYLPHMSLLVVLLLMLLLGFFTSAQIVPYPLITESNSPALTGTAQGLAAVLIMAGGCTQPLFGWLMGLRWNHMMVNQTPFYSVSDYRLALSIIPFGFIISLIVALAIKETYCRTLD